MVIFIAIIFHMIDRQSEYISRVDYKYVSDGFPPSVLFIIFDGFVFQLETTIAEETR